MEKRVTYRELFGVVSWAAVAVAIALVVSIGARSVASWRYWGDLDHNSSGTWLCMSLDLRDGVLYRPFESDMGYGGTRYAPLFPLIIAGFLRAGAGPVLSGFLAGIAAAILTIAGLYALMRRLGVPLKIAAAMAVFALAATCTRTILLGIKGDLLPLGFSLWGLCAVSWSMEEGKSRGWLAVAAACFVLALTAKVTSIFGLATGMIWLIFQRRSRRAAILGLLWLAGMAIAVLVIHFASNGRAESIFRLCSGGGGGLRRLMKGPGLLATALATQDRTLLGLWIIALLVIVAAHAWKTLPAIFFLVATAGTVAIYGSPGTHLNHLVDMNAAALLVIAVVTLRTRAVQNSVIAITLLLVLAAAAACWRQVREIRQSNQRGQVAAALADVKSLGGTGPILAENPMVPMLVGQQPYLLDPFMFRDLRAKIPGYADKMWHDLSARKFSAVILHNSPDDPLYSTDEYDFGAGFIDRVEKDYVLTSAQHSYFVLTPRR